jgi:uncharacterized protein (DUF849 family)
MNFEVFITCALAGAGDTPSRSDKVPLTPRDIAASAVEAAKAGAAIAHIHVRNPDVTLRLMVRRRSEHLQ